MKKLAPLLVLALIIRAILMPVAMHPDFRAYNLAAFLIAQKGEVFSFYDHIRLLPRIDPLVGIYHDNQFNYPPLAYLSHGLSNFILGPIMPWQAFDKLIYDYDHFRGSPNSVLLLYLLKFPYLIADLIGLWLILKLGNSEKEKFNLGVIWLFNPINLYSAYMMGQFDIFIGVLILGALVLSQKSKNSWAAILLGLAGGVKLFPLIMLPFLPGKRIRNIAVGLLTYLVVILPYLPSIGFRQYALLASQSDKPLYAKIMVSGSQYIPIFVLGMGLLMWWSYNSKKPLKNWVGLSAPFFLFFAVTHFHPQWFAWVVPFLCLAWVQYPKIKWLLLAFVICFAVIVFSFDPSLHLGMFGINWDIMKAINPYYASDQLVSIFRGLFAACSMIIFYEISKSHIPE